MTTYTEDIEHRIDIQEGIISSLVEEIKTLEKRIQEVRLVYSVNWVIEQEKDTIYGYGEDFEGACRLLCKGLAEWEECRFQYSVEQKHKPEFIDVDYWWIGITEPNSKIVDFAVQISPEGEIMSSLSETYRETYERVKNART